MKDVKVKGCKGVRGKEKNERREMRGEHEVIGKRRHEVRGRGKLQRQRMQRGN